MGWKKMQKEEKLFNQGRKMGLITQTRETYGLWKMRGIEERAHGSSYKHERWENEPIKRVREYATMLEMI